MGVDARGRGVERQRVSIERQHVSVCCTAASQPSLLQVLQSCTSTWVSALT